jgi:hypothetical protein
MLTWGHLVRPLATVGFARNGRCAVIGYLIPPAHCLVVPELPTGSSSPCSWPCGGTVGMVFGGVGLPAGSGAGPQV